MVEEDEEKMSFDVRDFDNVLMLEEPVIVKFHARLVGRGGKKLIAEMEGSFDKIAVKTRPDGNLGDDKIMTDMETSWYLVSDNVKGLIKEYRRKKDEKI